MREIVEFGKAFKGQVVLIITGSGVALASWATDHFFPQKQLPTYLYWLIILGTFVAASFRMWRTEHIEKLELKVLLIKEYEELVRQLQGGKNTVFGSEESRDKLFLDKIKGDRVCLREAIRLHFNAT